MESINIAAAALSVIFFLCCGYQFFYMALAIFKKHRRFPEPARRGRYAVLIAARNEEAVIEGLLSDLKAQNYPEELLDVYVVADNCTDATAAIARRAGASCYERFDKVHVGKGYALAFLLDRIGENQGLAAYDGYFVFDADNLVDPNYVAEMDRTFMAGYRVVVGCRNSKNFGDNWISAGYALWFLRDSRYLNGARMLAGTSSAVTGTGFLVSSEIFLLDGGWTHFGLTEDSEFTADLITRGEYVAYCARAVLYDEQPVTFSQSWDQRLRWAKGYVQVFAAYGGKLFCSMFKPGGFAAFDMVMTYLPAVALAIAYGILYLGAFLLAVTTPGLGLVPLLTMALTGFAWAYGTMFAIGLITTVTEWHSIRCPAGKKVLYLFTFPIFMMTYVPVSLAAVFCKVEWKPIHHGAKSLSSVHTV